jgi:two-component system, NtrC family, sensor kinase
MKLQSSLRQKITLGYLGYYLMALLVVALSLFTYLELRFIEQKISLGEQITELFDAALEIRRFEKNYFLYRQDADLQEGNRYAAKIEELLNRNTLEFSNLTLAPRLATLRNEVRAYRALMAEYARAGPTDSRHKDTLEAQIRKTGKVIVTISESMAGAERRLIRAALDRFRATLVISIVLLSLSMIAIGWMLSRMVVRPLRHMDRCVESLAGGKLLNQDKLTTPSADREIVAITQAFNHMITELELRQKRLLRSEKLAALGTLLAGVAHELNNPLSNISLSCQILLEEIGESDTERKTELLEQIDGQTERARNIVRALLDFARDRPLRREPVALAPLLDETIQFLKGETTPGIHIAGEIPADIVLQADRQRLQQAFLNLIKNALQALGDAGEVQIRASLRQSANPAGAASANAGCHLSQEAVDIEIRDTGPGIPADILPRISTRSSPPRMSGAGWGWDYSSSTKS